MPCDAPASYSFRSTANAPFETPANCHGPDGDQITGIDLGWGQFRRPGLDADVAIAAGNALLAYALP
jgi:hypothetical protein